MDVLSDVDDSDRSDVSALDFVDEEMKGEGETYRIGFYYVFELVVTVTDGELDVKLNVAGATVNEATLTPEHTSATLAGHAVFAKWSLTLTANFDDRSLHPSGKGCYWDVEWECATFDKTILNF